MHITKIGKRGLDLIKSFEGFSSKPYLCPANVPTIGYGATYYPNGKRVTLSDKHITEEEGSALLLVTLAQYEKDVDSMTRDDINQQMYDSLCSFSYNLGSNALRKSTLLKKVNANPNDPLIKDEFMKWVNAGGRKLSGLVKRREAESKLYFDLAY